MNAGNDHSIGKVGSSADGHIFCVKILLVNGYHPRNLAVGCQKLYGSNKHWKERYGYHKRSLSETAMYRVKQLLGGRLSLRNYNAQVGETYAMSKALNKITGLGMPKTCRIG